MVQAHAVLARLSRMAQTASLMQVSQALNVSVVPDCFSWIVWRTPSPASANISEQNPAKLCPFCRY